MNFHPVENSSATAEVVVPILNNWYHPKSVMDLGCNVGWWLYWFMGLYNADVIGIDGNNMIEGLKIPEYRFICADLTKPIIYPSKYALPSKFDLLLCLEVAEHLDEKHADTLINAATMHSDIIFWSAATPGQTGYNHVNEQPHEYWIEKFAHRGYKHRLLSDLLPILPHDYYRKNAIEFIKNV